MKSPSDILDELGKTIAHMHHRSGMYAGSLDAPSTADVLDGMFWQVHSWWAWIQERHEDFHRTLDGVREQRKCAPLGFAGGYRNANPDAANEEVARFVLDAWKDVSIALDIDISEGRARTT